jgi:hypothetical protein
VAVASLLSCSVAETDPLDLLAKTQLAELYEQLGLRQKALDMVNDRK